MLKRFLPREDGFFQLFQKAADILVNSTTEFHSMLHNLKDFQTRVETTVAIEFAAS